MILRIEASPQNPRCSLWPICGQAFKVESENRTQASLQIFLQKDLATSPLFNRIFPVCKHDKAVQIRRW